MRNREVWQLIGVGVGIVAVAACILLSYTTLAGGDLDCPQSGTRGTVRWDRYIDSDGSIDERPNPKAGFDTVRLTICNDGTVRGRIDRTAPRR